MVSADLSMASWDCMDTLSGSSKVQKDPSDVIIRDVRQHTLHFEADLLPSCCCFFVLLMRGGIAANTT